MTTFLFGRLTLRAFMHGWLVTGGVVTMLLAMAAVIGLLTYFRKWRWLWKEWITTTDHKRIGVMYLIVSFLMLARGLMDALMLRFQQSLGGEGAFLSPTHFQEMFSAHGTMMIFFVAMGLMFGLINLILPLQIGARDVAFPFMNAASFWLFAAGMVLINTALIIGEPSAAGWLAYPPLSELKYSPGVGVDYWIWSLQVSGIGSLLSGVNFIATIMKLRAPGMTLMRMPIFVWSVLTSMVLVAFAFPILTVALTLLSLDRTLGFHIFTSEFGGNAMLYVNLIWAWGHPEVYILILPAFGAFSEIVATLSKKRLFGYASMVYALLAIGVLSFAVWLHHFFTMGAGADVNAFFGIMTAVIAVPTGVKVFNWLFTLYKARVSLATPMLWFLGFVVTFTIGGMAGVLMSVPAADFQLHNTLFLVAHFHTMIVGGVLFGYFAAFTYWLPKFTGFKLDERLGTYAFWSWLVGFVVAFMPLYALGLMGATRRLDHYDASLGYGWLFAISGFGVLLILQGLGFQALQLGVSYLRRDRLKAGEDPWDGRTLEWATATPPAPYNFAVIPTVTGRDTFWEMKKDLPLKKVYTDLHLPKNSPLGFLIGLLALIFGFAVTWHIVWLWPLALGGIMACIMIRYSDEETEYIFPASEVRRLEEARHA